MGFQDKGGWWWVLGVRESQVRIQEASESKEIGPSTLDQMSGIAVSASTKTTRILFVWLAFLFALCLFFLNRKYMYIKQISKKIPKGILNGNLILTLGSQLSNSLPEFLLGPFHR